MFTGLNCASQDRLAKTSLVLEMEKSKNHNFTLLRAFIPLKEIQYIAHRASAMVSERTGLKSYLSSAFIATLENVFNFKNPQLPYL